MYVWSQRTGFIWGKFGDLFGENLFWEGLGLPEDFPDLQTEWAPCSVGPFHSKVFSFKTKETIKEIHLAFSFLKNNRSTHRSTKFWKKTELNIKLSSWKGYAFMLEHKGRTKLYDTIEKALKDLANRGYTVKTIRMPKTMMEHIRQLTWRKVGRWVRKGTSITGWDFGKMEKWEFMANPVQRWVSYTTKPT